MKIERINEMISGGESITVEFKQSKTKLNRDVFESVCALENDVFNKVRKLAVSQRPDHPWKSMDNLELLKSAGLYLKDLQSGKRRNNIRWDSSFW